MPKSTVLITGASSGIGKATAILMHQRGYQVFASSRSLDGMTDLQAEGITTVLLDVTKDDSIKAALKQIGPVEVLINNAGYGSYGALEDVPMEEARAQFDVNVFGLARLTQLVLPDMREAGQGTIINLASIAARFSVSLGAWYHATKYAVEGLTDALKQEVEPFGVKVAVIEPGAIRTGWGNRAIEGLQKASGDGAYAKQVPGRVNFLKTTNSRSASSPEVVAHKIVAVVEAKHPKFRYPVGHGAHLLVWSRRLLPDKLFYRILKQV
ncbi:MAG: oxidoreductase [Candidatus Saccharimonadales bacterium]